MCRKRKSVQMWCKDFNDVKNFYNTNRILERTLLKIDLDWETTSCPAHVIHSSIFSTPYKLHRISSVSKKLVNNALKQVKFTICILRQYFEPADIWVRYLLLLHDNHQTFGKWEVWLLTTKKISQWLCYFICDFPTWRLTRRKFYELSFISYT